MRKIKESYVHDETGMTFDVEFIGDVDADAQKKVSINPSPNTYRNDRGFIFNKSKTANIIKVGKALQEIGEFVESLKDQPK